MMKSRLFFVWLAAGLFAACGKDPEPETKVPERPAPTLDNSTRQIILTEQASASIRIFDQPTRTHLWTWDASTGIPESRASWFNLPDEAKPVMDRSCLLVTASGGGVALVRIQPKEVLFYAKPAGNPHSAELLPDGSIVVASSTGNKLTLYDVDLNTGYASSARQTLTLDSAHGVVWDKKRQCLWAAGGSAINSYSYRDKTLTLLYSTPLPDSNAHDLVPVYGEDRLLVSTGSRVYYFNPEDRSFTPFANAASVSNIKSLSTGPTGFPILSTTPTESWYTDQVLDFKTGIRAFYLAGAQIYKARWRVDNTFSY